MRRGFQELAKHAGVHQGKSDVSSAALGRLGAGDPTSETKEPKGFIKECGLKADAEMQTRFGDDDV